MKRLSVFLFSVFTFVISFSQTYTISGRVIERTKAAVLSNANVYINNSSRGTVTSNDGHYSISGLQPGKYELVVSFVGFETVVKQIEVTNQNIELNISLDKKEKVLREVLILDDATRKRYLGIFKENLLGYTTSAKRCRIRNLDAVDFTFGPEKGDLLAFADEDLVIDNPDAGYIIHFQMTDFYYNTQTGGSYFFGYLRFEDMAKNGSPEKKWIKRRNENYYGSSMHFYRSLVKNELTKEGYKLVEHRIIQLGASPQKKVNINKQSNSVTVQNSATSNIAIAVPVNEDSILSLYSDSAYKIFEMQLKGALKITYKKNTQLKIEMNRTGNLFGQPDKGAFSGLRKRETPILIDYKGLMLTPMNVYYDGIWIYERMANMLPEDYVPEE